jgi:hypothetical protein
MQFRCTGIQQHGKDESGRPVYKLTFKQEGGPQLAGDRARDTGTLTVYHYETGEYAVGTTYEFAQISERTALEDGVMWGFTLASISRRL